MRSEEEIRKLLKYLDEKEDVYLQIGNDKDCAVIWGQINSLKWVLNDKGEK